MSCNYERTVIFIIMFLLTSYDTFRGRRQWRSAKYNLLQNAHYNMMIFTSFQGFHYAADARSQTATASDDVICSVARLASPTNSAPPLPNANCPDLDLGPVPTAHDSAPVRPPCAPPRLGARVACHATWFHRWRNGRRLCGQGSVPHRWSLTTTYVLSPTPPADMSLSQAQLWFVHALWQNVVELVNWR